MKIYVGVIIVVLLLQNLKAQIKIDQDNYAWKKFGQLDDQQINLSRFKSPNLRQDQDSDRTVILCASGGGLRSAAFVTGVLLELERIGLKAFESHKLSTVNAANEIDYFSTTSGGGWGVGSFIAYRYTIVNRLQNEYPSFNSFETRLANWMDRSYAKYQLRYFVRSLIHIGNINRWSSLTMTNRLNFGYLGYGYLTELSENAYLEKHGNSNGYVADSTKVLRLGDVFTLADSDKHPRLPMMICNTTNISTFSLVPFTPDRLNFWGVRQYDLTASYWKGTPDVLTEEELLEMPLALGIKSSSSVPGFIGATSFAAKRNSKPFYLYLEDGGIVDNQGLHTAKAILRQTKNIISHNDKRIVFIVDAAKSGIDVVLPKKRSPRRFKTLVSVASGAAPDAQYHLMRENVQKLEDEYNCTLIYFGTEILLNPSIGLAPLPSFSKTTSISRKEAERKLYLCESMARSDPYYFSKKCSFEDRRLLYEYIRLYIKTWFSAKGTVDSGRTITDLNLTTGYGRIMRLAGRAVVQLQAEQIRQAMGYVDNE